MVCHVLFAMLIILPNSVVIQVVSGKFDVALILLFLLGSILAPSASFKILFASISSLLSEYGRLLCRCFGLTPLGVPWISLM